MQKVVAAAWKNSVEVFGIQEVDVMQVPPGSHDPGEGDKKTELTKEHNVEKEEWPSLGASGGVPTD